MKLKESINKLKTIWLITTMKSFQQTGMILFISGKYQREWKEGNTIMVERISIQQISIIADMFCVRKIVIKQNSPDQKVVYENKADEWKATYDYSRRQLLEVAGKRVCSFIPENSILFIGEVEYTKIKSEKEKMAISENN